MSGSPSADDLGIEWTKEDCTTLSLKNPHPFDKLIKFHEPSHAYGIFAKEKWRTKPEVVSVSAIVESVKPKFDADLRSGFTARKMMGLAEKFIKSKFKTLEDFEAMKRSIFGDYAHLYRPPTSDRGKDWVSWSRDIREWWEENGAAEARKGTEFHRDGERHFDGQPPLLPPSAEWTQFLRWLAKDPEMVPYRTEWRMFDPDLLLAGSSDLIFTKRGKFYLADWKRYKDVFDARKAKWDPELAIGPLAHLELPWSTVLGCEIQLNCYARILERYGIHIEACLIVSCHPNQEDFIEIECRPVADIIDLCLAHRRAAVARVPVALAVPEGEEDVPMAVAVTPCKSL